jgi:RNA recognition motif-containing protein
MNMTKLFVVGFPRDMDEIELLELFTSYGQVGIVTIVTDKDSGLSQGYGFVHMDDQAGAERAIAALDGAEIDERKISVRIAENKSAPVVKPVQATQKGNSTHKYIKKKRPRIGG